MQRLRSLYKVILRTINSRPKLVVVIVLFGVLGLFCTVEYLRAERYLHRVDGYKRTGTVVSMIDAIDRVVRGVDSQPNTLFCQISIPLLVEERFADKAGKSPENYLAEAGEYAELASPTPGFNSFAQFIPKVAKAREESVRLHKSMQEIQQLTREDLRSVYCRSLVTALEEVYYLETLSTPQGVGALHVAQQNNFIDNVGIAQDRIKTILPPDLYAPEHEEVFEYLNELRLDLQGDVTEYEAFSRSVEDGTNELVNAFSAIQSKSSDLAQGRDLLILHASHFIPETEN